MLEWCPSDSVAQQLCSPLSNSSQLGVSQSQACYQQDFFLNPTLFWQQTTSQHKQLSLPSRHKILEELKLDILL